MRADGPLAGTVAIVTGALGNLGPVWTRALTEAGADVVGLDLREQDGVRVADVTDRESLERARAELAGEDRVPGVLVNNAGIDRPPGGAGSHHRAEDIPVDEFRATLDVNLTGAFLATQVFGGAMVAAGRGSIINIGSLYASIAPDPSFYAHIDVDPPFIKPPAYAASKAGVVALTRYFARLWGPRGVRVNALSPGGVRGGQDDEFLRKYTARVPLGRMADSEDLTGPLLFLAGDASRYMTGHELRVDGGFTA